MNTRAAAPTSAEIGENSRIRAAIFNGGELGPNNVRANPHSALVLAEGTRCDSDYDRTGCYAYFHLLEGLTLKPIRKMAVPEAHGVP
ncbi:MULTISPECIES: hypothetical protein [Stenotrophomonas]|uniref:Uncharacterized protein n=1 Tax=Stenotrophomonas maltophilia TaxID=40324 RepID=A0A3S0JF70_STEMA|nr:hypothetical protein [Stenotrophomonas maltophilia]RTQ86082.1 hypothetical protein EKL94_19085 [Stenotrophomonas maltophilia]